MRWTLIVALLWTLAGCGGGGGGNSDSTTGSVSAGTLQISLDTPHVTQAFIADGQTPNVQTVRTTVTVAGTAPVALYAQVRSSSPVVVDGIYAAEHVGDNGFAFKPFVNRSTPLGTYTGTFTLTFCADAGCTQVYSNAPVQVGFTLTATPLLQLSTMVNGVLAPDPLNVVAKSGDLLTITSNIPIRSWQVAMGGAHEEQVVETSTTWTARPVYGQSPPEGPAYLSVYIMAETTQPGRVDFTVYP